MVKKNEKKKIRCDRVHEFAHDDMIIMMIMNRRRRRKKRILISILLLLVRKAEIIAINH